MPFKKRKHFSFECVLFFNLIYAYNSVCIISLPINTKTYNFLVSLTLTLRHIPFRCYIDLAQNSHIYLKSRCLYAYAKRGYRTDPVFFFF